MRDEQSKPTLAHKAPERKKTIISKIKLDIRGSISLYWLYISNGWHNSLKIPSVANRPNAATRPPEHITLIHLT